MAEWLTVEMKVSGANPGTFTINLEDDDEPEPTTTDLLLAMFPSTLTEG